MKEEKWDIKFEYDSKTGLLTKMELPADLPAEQRMSLEIPFIQSLVATIRQLDADINKHSRILNKLTIVLIVLTVVLVTLGFLQIVR